jgi:hypothetical protein
MKMFATFVLISVSLQFAQAQKIDFPADFRQILNQTGVEFFEPLDACYKDFQPPVNEFQNCQFAIRSRREDMEIRYLVIPWNENNPATTAPHVITFRTLTTLASNADEAVISAIQPEKEVLQKDFNADWGMIYFFQPKAGISDLPNCRMVALHKEGKGTVFVFYHFKDAENEALDARYLAVRFVQ